MNLISLFHRGNVIYCVNKANKQQQLQQQLIICVFGIVNVTLFHTFLLEICFANWQEYAPMLDKEDMNWKRNVLNEDFLTFGM